MSRGPKNMDTFKRILNSLERIKKSKSAWDLTFGQIVDIAIGPKANLYHMKDEVVLMRLEELRERIRKQENNQ